MSGVGKPLSSERVHRAERFARLSGLEMGQVITAEAIQRVLAHPEGGMKNIPETSRRMLLLTQADEPELQAVAASIAEKLLPYFDSIVTSCGIRIDKHGEGIVQLEALSVHEPTAGIVLAAGGATRFGQAKQLLDWQGKPFVRQVAETALQAGLSPVIVVVGAYAEEVSKAVEDLPVHLVRNSSWEQGHATSVICGIHSLPEKTSAAVFLYVTNRRCHCVWYAYWLKCTNER
jgi:molybdenum cofactor cytidylyltransferase